MEWLKAFDQNTKPTSQQIGEFISNPLWEQLNEYIKNSYQVQPTFAYSSCSAQPGWNVKYQKAGRSLCTLYPMPGYFIALVVIGTKEQMEAELLMPTLTAYVQSLYKSAASVMGGRWLMISVTDETVLSDVKALIGTRRKSK